MLRATLTAATLLLSYGLSFGQAEMMAAEDEAHFHLMRSGEAAGVTQQERVQQLYEIDLRRARIAPLFSDDVTWEETDKLVEQVERRRKFYMTLANECPEVMRCGTDMECEEAWMACPPREELDELWIEIQDND